MSRTDWRIAYLPSRKVSERLAREDCYAHVRVQLLFSTKDVTLRIQHTRHSSGGRLVSILRGIPIDHAPTREDIDAIWYALFERMLHVVLGKETA